MIPYNDVFWQWAPMGTVIRPLPSTPENQKDQDYDNNCMRYYLSMQVFQSYRDSFLQEYSLNRTSVENGPLSFGSSEQMREFLGDTNSPTARLAWRQAISQPIHTRLVGAADNISVAVKVFSTAQNLFLRSEEALYTQLLRSRAAQAGPEMEEAMQKYGVSPNEDDTREKHENYWTDPYAKTMTNLASGIARHQKLDRKKRQIASNLALSGVAALHFYPNGNHIECDVCRPDEIGWDSTSTRPDFSDGEFCYTSRQMNVSALAERYQPARAKLLQLEKWAYQTGSAAFNNQQGGWGWGQRCPRVFTGYYKDRVTMDWGYVIKDGEPHFCPIGRPDPSKRDGAPEYTEKDLIDPPENEWTVTWTDQQWKSKKISKMSEILRYCVFIPWEYLPGPFTEGKEYGKRSEIKRRYWAEQNLGPTGDLVLESGIYPLQESNPEQAFSVEFPLKFSSWMYLNGRVLAPMSAARDAQAMMNAVLSDLMMRMSRADMPTTAIADEAIGSAGMGEKKILQNLKDGTPIRLKASIMGSIQNSIQTVGNVLDGRFYQMFSILDRVYAMAQNATGIYDQNFGAPVDADTLKGVKELQARQSGVMLQPFFAAIQEVFEQGHQFNTQAGKRFYAARPESLKQMVGDEGARIVEISKDMSNEQFRAEVKLTLDAEQRKQQANEMILAEGGFLDRQLLDAESAAQLLDRSFPEDVAEGARAFTKRMVEANKLAAQQQQQQQAAMAQAGQQQALDEQEMELARMSLEQSKIQMADDTKRTAPVRQALSEHLKPMETPSGEMV